MTSEQRLPLATEINLQTGKIHWQELHLAFAQGRLYWVSPELDLTEVAQVLAEDQGSTLNKWIEAHQFKGISDEMAQAFETKNPQFWATVIAPYILIQPTNLEANT